MSTLNELAEEVKLLRRQRDKLLDAARHVMEETTAHPPTMKIDRNPVERVSLGQFAAQYRLTLRISERPHEMGNLPRYWVNFPNVDLKDGACLMGCSGNGNTEEEAIADYVVQLSGRLLVIDAYLGTRREVVVYLEGGKP